MELKIANFVIKIKSNTVMFYGYSGFYDVYDSEYEYLGYVRYRRGHFTVYAFDPKSYSNFTLVWSKTIEGFCNNIIGKNRNKYLKKAAKKILKWNEKNK